MEVMVRVGMMVRWRRWWWGGDGGGGDGEGGVMVRVG